MDSTGVTRFDLALSGFIQFMIAEDPDGSRCPIIFLFTLNNCKHIFAFVPIYQDIRNRNQKVTLKK